MYYFRLSASGLLVVGRPDHGHRSLLVTTDKTLPKVAYDKIYLCPSDMMEAAHSHSSWPSQPFVLSNAERCLDHQELLDYDSWEHGEGDFMKNRLKCIAEVTETTTKVMEEIGMDVFLHAGTLLGWYRHNGGQIPWDLDGDTAVDGRQCDRAFAQLSDGKYQNIAGYMQDRVPPGWQVFSIYNNETADDALTAFDACETQELRVGATVSSHWCWTDIWLFSDEASYPGRCQCSDNISKPRMCLDSAPFVCVDENDIFPLQSSTIADDKQVKVPSNPVQALQARYPDRSWELKNLQMVPTNYLFEKNWFVVVAEPVTVVSWPTLALVLLPLCISALLCFLVCRRKRTTVRRNSLAE